MAMGSTINDTRAMDVPTPIEQAETSEGLRLARLYWLEEAIGLVFGLLTVGYILLSLAGLN
jgi:hypothetical protein